MKKLYAYIASPCGFAPESTEQFYYGQLLPIIRRHGFELLDPWKLTDQSVIDRATCTPEGPQRRIAWQVANEIIAEHNTNAIRRCDVVVAILDGSDVDSGTASEIGFAYGIEKTIIGYRNDFRLSSDNVGSTVNLQVEYFIHESAGTIVRNLYELENTLIFWYQKLQR